MDQAQYNGINWGTTEETTGQACLQNFDPAFYQNQAKKPKWVADTNEVLVCGMLKALLDAHRLVWCAQLRYDLRTGNITAEAAPSWSELVSGTPSPVGSTETRQKVRQFAAGDPVLEAVPALYDLVCFEVLQAIRSSRPIKEPQPLVGSSLSAVHAQLGALPAVAIVALGVAAIAGATYLGSEGSIAFSKAWSAIEIEKAWAVQRAWAEVEVAKQKIAAGQKVELSDWAKMRVGVASASQTPWAPLALGGALAAVIGASAYLLRDKSPAVRHANPAHFVPRRRRIRRKKHVAASPKRRRNAAPKRKRNPKPNPQPRKAKSARKDARKRNVRPSTKFVRSQRAKGRTDAQARAAWKLSHGKKAKKGRRGKR